MRKGTLARLSAISALGLAFAVAASGSSGLASSARLNRTTVPTRGAQPGYSGPSVPFAQGGRNVNITNKSGAQSETSIAVDPTDANHIIAASNDLANFSTYNGVYESFDRGLTWANAGLSINAFCYDPWLDFNKAGDIFFGYECSDQRIAYRLHGTNNWVASGSLPAGSFPDRDMVVTDDNPSSPFFNSVYIGYDDNGSSNRAQLMISRNGQGGWVKSAGIDDTPNTFDVIGVNAAALPNGDVTACWEDYANRRLECDISHDGGLTWGVDRLVHSYRIDTTPFFISIPPQNSRGVLPMPMTDTAPEGSTFSGRLYVTYFDKGTVGSNTNVYFRWSDDGGATWSNEVMINDGSTTAYRFFPTISVAPNGTIAVSFYDTRNDPTNKKTDQFVSFSTDGGATWSANLRVTKAQSDETINFDANQYGDYEGADASSTNFFQLVWTDSRPGTRNEDMATASVRP